MPEEQFPEPSQTDELQWIDDYNQMRLQLIAEQESRGEVIGDITPQSALDAVIPHLEFKLEVLARALGRGRITQEAYEQLVKNVQVQLTTFREMDPGTSYFDALRISLDYEVAEMRRDIVVREQWIE